MSKDPAQTAPPRPLDVIVLAAGAGTRMKSNLPKVLHRVAGRPMAAWAIKAAQELGARRVVVVTGHGAEAVERELQQPGVTFARQAQQLGTGNAFICGAEALPGGADVLVLSGDAPLLRPETLREMLDQHRAANSAMTVLTGELEDPAGYGRVVRGPNGDVERIVEQKDATPEEAAIHEFNSGVYLFDGRAQELARQLTNDNAAGEYYLTDLLALYRANGGKVSAYCLADPSEVLGANDRAGLAELEAALQRRIQRRHQAAGITILLPDTVYIGAEVELERDVLLEPGVILRGKTRVAEGATIGAYSVLTDSEVDPGAEIRPHSVLESAQVGPQCQVGPFARLRPGTRLAADVHIGNFVETKNAQLAAGVKAGHLAYLGDVTIGEETNVGAGTIVANFDGVNKHRSEVGAGAFIGSNSTLVAPRQVGDAAFIAAGSTVHMDVPEGAMAIARGRQRNIEGWSKRYWRGLGEKVGQKLPWLAAWLAKQPNNEQQS